MLHVTLRYRDASGRLFETNCDATRNPFSEEAAFATGVSGLARRQQSLPESGSRICSRDQEEASQRIRKTQKAEFFYAEDTQLYTAMFPDSASARDCVDCHNRHGESPKKDWKLGDMMGATTWTYPAKDVSHAELLTILAAVHQGVRDAYGAFLTKAETFTRKPEVGTRWPRDGYFLPSTDVFLAEFARRSSPQTLQRLLDTPR